MPVTSIVSAPCSMAGTKRAPPALIAFIWVRKPPSREAMPMMCRPTKILVTTSIVLDRIRRIARAFGQGARNRRIGQDMPVPGLRRR